MDDHGVIQRHLKKLYRFVKMGLKVKIYLKNEHIKHLHLLTIRLKGTFDLDLIPIPKSNPVFYFNQNLAVI